MKISILGSGYVGVVSGACLAAAGHKVICVDIKPEVVRQINDGHTPVYEAGLGELLQDMVRTKMLSATTDAAAAVLETDVTFICVGTPNEVSGIDLQQIVSAAENVGNALVEKVGYHVVAVKSTVLPGITEGVVKQTIEERSGRKLGDGWGLCMNPEFLREGRAVADFMSPDRVIIGASDGRAGEALLGVYVHLNCPKIVTTPKTAEMIKYVSNALFATMISFSNEIANVCSAIPNVDARNVWNGVHLDRRLTPPPEEGGRPAGLIEYLWHGLGFGGSCFPKDVQALREFGKRRGQLTPMLDAVLATNESQPLRLVSLLEKEMDVTGRTVAVLGLAFKPGTDDLRESPALAVVTALRQHGAHVIAHDPIAMPRAKSHSILEGVSFASDWASALKQADACIVVTAWPEYQKIRPGDFKRLMRNPLVIDGRGMFDPNKIAGSGVKWRGIGYLPEKSRILDQRSFENARTEQTLAGSDAWLKQPNLLDLLHETVMTRNMNGRIKYWNRGASEMYGWTKEEAVGKVSHKLLQTTFPDSLENIESELAQKGLWEGQLVHTKRNGSAIIVKSRWVLKRGRRGHGSEVIEVNQIRHYMYAALAYLCEAFLLVP